MCRMTPLSGNSTERVVRDKIASAPRLTCGAPAGRSSTGTRDRAFFVSMPLSVFHRGLPGFVVRDVGELPPHEHDEHAGAGKGEPEGAGHAEVAGAGAAYGGADQGRRRHQRLLTLATRPCKASGTAR